MRVFLLASALIAAMCLGSATAWCLEFGESPYGASVMGTRESGTASQSWLYTVTNTSASENYSLWLVAIEVDEECDVLGVITPDGWTVDSDSQPHFVTWMCFGDSLPQGGAQSGFGITFSGEPVYQTYSVMFDNIDDPNDTQVDFGEVILSNATVPEPASIAVLLIGLAGFRLKRRK